MVLHLQTDQFMIHPYLAYPGTLGPISGISPLETLQHAPATPIKMSLEDCWLREVPILGSVSERLEHCCSFFPIHAKPKFRSHSHRNCLMIVGYFHQESIIDVSYNENNSLKILNFTGHIHTTVAWYWSIVAF